ncbi:hypothetical protein ATO6_08860 [Oceanicola sp. 22II-s10i]|nr:hypothetical protein ATO6_08860 [Oceanicola sp. 22II-s10i]
MSEGRERAGLALALAVMGAGWGLTQPLGKIAVTGGLGPLGMVFWQLILSILILGAICLATGRRLWPRGGAQVAICLAVALLGTILPNTASYHAAAHLPSGVLSVLVSLVPLMAFPMALMLGAERFSFTRLAGLGLGLSGVLLLVVPEASLPDPAMAVWVPLGLVAPFLYACEGNVVARWGTAGLDPLELLCAASILGAGLALPLSLMTGEWVDPRGPWGAPEWALIGSSLIHAVVYTGYVWIIGRAGPVFAVQVGYFVTGFGVIWAMLILNETYSPWIWTAMALIVAGMLLVQPRPKGVLAPSGAV